MARHFRSVRPLFLLPILVVFATFFSGCSDPEARFEERFQEASSLIDQGRYEQAIESLNQINEEFPDRGVVLQAMGRAYEGADEDFFAALFYEQAGRVDAEFTESLLSAARLFYAEGDRGRALTTLNDYLELYPDDAEAWRLSGEMLAEERRFQSALSAHLRAERLDGPSRNPEYAVAMGELYLEAGNLPQAEIHFQTALQEAPDDRFRALLGLLATTYRTENYEQSEELLEMLNDEFPGAVEASSLAAVQEEVRVWRLKQEALAEQIAALENRPDPEEIVEEEAEEMETEIENGEDQGLGEESVVGEGTVLLAGGSTSGKFAGLEEEVEEMIELPEPEPLPPPPPPEPTTRELALAARDEGDLDRAIPLYWKAVQEDPDNAAVWAELSRAYLMEGDAENAEIAILEARRREPGSLQYTLSYLNVIQQSRSRARFMEELENAYARIPNSPDIVLAMARAYAQPGGNPTNAAYFYREFLKMAPGHPEVAVARRELNALP